MSDKNAAGDETRRLTDPRAMRALAHPLRLSLVELLTLDGPHTATQAADKVGESPSNCSFHLRQLAKYGFVEEAGDGSGRQRPWRMTRIGTQMSNVHADVETAVAAELLNDMFQERIFDRWRRWRETKGSYPQEWQEIAGTSESIWWLTPAELRELDAEIMALALRYRERLIDPTLRPAGAEPVEFVALTFPIRPPTTGG